MSGAKSSYVAPVHSTTVAERARREREAAELAERKRREAAERAERKRREAAERAEQRRREAEARAEQAQLERERQEAERRRLEAERQEQRRAAAVAEASGARTGGTSFSRRVVDAGEPEEIRPTPPQSQDPRAEQQPGHQVDPAQPQGAARSGAPVDAAIPIAVPTLPEREARSDRIRQILARVGPGVTVDAEEQDGLVRAAHEVDSVREWEDLQDRTRRVASEARAAAEQAVQASADEAAALAEQQERERSAAEQAQAEEADRAAQLAAEQDEARELLASIESLDSQELVIVRTDLEGVLRAEQHLDGRLRDKVRGARIRAEEAEVQRVTDRERAFELLGSLGDLDAAVLEQPRADLEAVIAGTERMDDQLEEVVARARHLATRERVAAVLEEMGVQLTVTGAATGSWRGQVPLDDNGGASLIILDDQGLSLVAVHDADLTEEQIVEVEHRNCELANAVDVKVADSGISTTRYQDLRPGERVRPNAEAAAVSTDAERSVTTDTDESQRSRKRKGRGGQANSNRRTT